MVAVVSIGKHDIFMRNALLGFMGLGLCYYSIGWLVGWYPIITLLL